MHEFNSEIFWTAIQKLREFEPHGGVVHCITNFVTANDCANAILALGKEPCMANSPLECAEITGKSSALLLNMGTYSRETELAMLKSGKAANERHIPVILDPVGIHGSSFRRKSFEYLTGKVRASVVKGNLHEMCEIVPIKGVQTGGGAHFCEYVVRNAAKKLGCVCVMTGETDFISDGEKTVCLKNGSPHLTAVTGTGCMTGALIAAFSTVTHNDIAALCGVSMMNLCGEIAAENFRGTGSYKVELMDLFSKIGKEEIEKRLNYFEYKGEDL